MFNFAKSQKARILVLIIIILSILLGLTVTVKAIDSKPPVIVPQNIPGTTRTAGEMLVGTKPTFKITDDVKVEGVYYTWNKHLDAGPTKKPTAVRVNGSPKETIWEVPEAPTEPGSYELSIFAYDGTNQSLEIAIPYKIVRSFTVPEDKQQPEPDLKPTRATVKAGDVIPISFTDNTGIYYISYKWVKQSEFDVNDFLTGATKVYNPAGGRIDVPIPQEPDAWVLQWFATDFSNIVSIGCYARLTVKNDIVPPKITLKGDQTQYIDLSEKDTSYRYEDAGASAYDEADAKSVSVDIDLTDINDAISKKETRRTVIVFTATDSDGNTGYATRVVYIVDYTSLKELLSNIEKEKFVQSDYKEEAWKSYDEQLQKAKKMKDANKSNQEAITKQVEALQKEFDNLMNTESHKKINKQKLEDLKGKLAGLVGLEYNNNWQEIEDAIVKKYSQKSWNAIKELMEKAEEQTLQSKFESIIDSIQTETLVELPKIFETKVETEPNANKQYVKTGDKIKVTFSTNVELNLETSNAKLKIENAEYNVKKIETATDETLGIEGRKVYSFTYTFTGSENEGSISYALELRGMQENDSNDEKQANITFDKTAPTVNWSEQIEDNTTITVFEEYTIAKEDITVSDNYTQTESLKIEIQLDGKPYTTFENNVKEDHTVKYIVTDEAGNVTEKERHILVNPEDGEKNPEYIETKPTDEELKTTYDPFTTIESVKLPDNWEWIDKTEIPTVNKNKYIAKYTSTDNRYTNVESVELTVTVEKATPKLSQTTTEALNKLNATYDDTLEKVQLPKTVEETTAEETAGTFAWEKPTTEKVGQATEEGNEFELIYTATDTENYNTLKVTAKILVAKKAPTTDDLEYNFSQNTYTGKAQPVTVTAKQDLVGFGSIAVKYDESDTEPVNVKVYQVSVQITGGTNYSDITLQLGTYEIIRKDVEKDELEFNIDAINYDGQEHEIHVKAREGINGLGENITVSYYKDLEKLETKPKDVGDYIVKVSIDQGANYNSVTDMELGTFKINPKDISEEEITIKISNNDAVTYDGGEKIASLKMEITEPQSDLTIDDLDIKINDYSRENFLNEGRSTETQLIKAGKYTVSDYEVSGKGNYSGKVENVTFDGTFTINRSTEQEVPQVQLMGIDDGNSVVATAKGVTLAVTNSSLDNAKTKYSGGQENVATINPETGDITVLGFGDAKFKATFEATENYEEKASEEVTLTVKKATLNKENFSISEESELNPTYDGTVKKVEVNSQVEGLEENYEVKYYKMPDGTQEIEEPKDAGQYKIVVEFVGNNVYEAQNYEMGTLIIDPKDITINIRKTKEIVYGSKIDIENLALTEEEYEIVDNEGVKPTHNELTFKVKDAESLGKPLSVNNYEIVVICSNTNYTVSINNGENQFVVKERPVEITIIGNKTSKYGEEIDTNLTEGEYTIQSATDAEGEVGLLEGENLNPITFEVCKKETGELVDNLTDVGTYMIKAKSGNTNYKVTTKENENYTITPQIIVAKANDGSSIYGDKIQVPNYSMSGSFFGGTQVSLKTVIMKNEHDEYDPETEEILPVGEYTVKIKMDTSGSKNYEGQFTDGTYEVTKRAIAVTANDVTVKYGEDGKEQLKLVQPINGLVGEDAEEDLNVTLKVYRTDEGQEKDVTDELTTQPANGTYKIRGTSESKNYNVTVNEGTYTIQKADPIISEEAQRKLKELTANYGQKLKDVNIQLPQENTEGTPGNFKWQDSEETYVGNATLSESAGNSFKVIFTPTDEINYETKLLDAEIKVSKIDPTQSNVEGKIGETAIEKTPTETQEKQYTQVTYSGENITVNVTAKDIYNPELEGSIGTVTEQKYYKVTEQDAGENLQETQETKNVGKYVVKVDLTDGSNYNAITQIEVGRFEITKKAITDEDIKITLPQNTTYNPDNKAEVKIDYSSDDVKNNSDVQIEYKKVKQKGSPEVTEESLGDNAPTDAGDYKVEVTVTMKDNYTGTKNASGEFTILKADQPKPDFKIMSGSEVPQEISSVLMTDPSPKINLNNKDDIKENGKVTYTVTTLEEKQPENIAKISEDGTITLVGEGTVNIKVTYEETNNYNATISDEKTLTISKKGNLTEDDFNITIPEETIYDGNEKEVTVTPKDSRLNQNFKVEYKLVGEEQAKDGKPVDAGEYIITIKVSENEYYSEQEITVTEHFIIKKAQIEFTVTNNEVTYNGQQQQATVESNPQLDLTVKYYKDEVGEGTESAKDQGTYTIKVTTVGDKNHEGVTDKVLEDKFVISAKEVTLTVKEQSSIYGDQIKEITYSVDALQGEDQKEDLGIELIAIENIEQSETPLTEKSDVGSYKIILKKDKLNPNYTLTPESLEIEAKYSITQRNITIKPNDKSSVYGETVDIEDVETLVVSGNLVNDDKLDSIELQTVADNTTLAGTTDITVKSYDIKRQEKENEQKIVTGNYAITVQSGTYTITQRPITIKANGIEKNYGDPIESQYSYTVEEQKSETNFGLANNDEVKEAVYVVTPNLEGTPNVGTYKIKGTYTIKNDKDTDVTESYKINSVEGDYIIDPKAIEENDITINVPQDAVYNGEGKQATVEVNVGGKKLTSEDYDVTITYTKDGEPVQGNPTNAGTYEVTVNVKGKGNYSTTSPDGITKKETFTINAASIELKVTEQTSIYGDEINAINYEVIGLQNGEQKESLGIELIAVEDDGETEISSTSDAKQYNIKVKTEGLNPNYTITSQEIKEKYTITQRSLNITPISKSSVYGDEIDIQSVPSNVIADNLVNSDEITKITLETNATKQSPVGESYTITAKEATIERQVEEQDAKNVTQNYNIVYAEGKYTITAKQITVNIQPAESIYGEEITISNPGYTVEGLSNSEEPEILGIELEAVEKDGQTPLSVTSDVGTYDIIVKKSSTNSNYEITNVNDLKGKYTITARKITIRPDDKSSTYGEIVEQNLTYKVVSEKQLVNNDEIKVIKLETNATHESPVGSDYTITAEEVAITRGEKVVTGNYEISYEPGKYTINPAEISIEVTAQESIYGDPINAISYEVTGLKNGDDKQDLGIQLEAVEENTETPITSMSDAKEYTIKIKAENLNSNYTLSTKEVTEKYTITKRPIKIKPVDKSSTYGDEVVTNDIEISVVEGNLVNEDKLQNVILTTTANKTTSVGTQNITIQSYEIKREVVDSEQKDVGNNYTVTTQEGIYTITKRPITIKIDSIQKNYGDEVANLTYQEVTNLVNEDKIDIKLKTSQEISKETPVGVYPITVESYTITRGELDVKDNYQVNEEDGNYTIIEKEITEEEVIVNLPQNNQDDKIVYDTFAKTVTVTVGSLIKDVDYTETITYKKQGEEENLEGLPINAGTYEVTVVIEGINNYKTTNPITKNVSFTIEKAKPVVPQEGLDNLQATYGDKLSTVHLPDGFEFEILKTQPDTLVGDATGDSEGNSFNVIYTPKDVENYESATITVKVKVLKANQDAPDFDITLNGVVLGPEENIPVAGIAPVIKLNNEESKIGEINYSVESNEQNAISIDATSGEITLNNVGTATVKVTYTGDKNHNESSSSKQVRIVLSVLTKSDFVVENNTSTYGEDLQVNVKAREGILEGDIGTITKKYVYIQTADGAEVRESEPTANPTEAGKYKILIDVESGNKYDGIQDLEVGILTINKATQEKPILQLSKTEVIITEVEPVTITVQKESLAKVKPQYTTLPEGTITISEEGVITLNKVGKVTITAIFPATNNYEASQISEEVTLTIEKATLKASDFTIENQNPTYTGSPIDAQVTSNIQEVIVKEVKYYKDALGEGENTATEAGTYTIKVFTDETEKYYATPVEGLEITNSWKIEKAVYNLPKEITFENKQVNYNGNNHTITVSSNLPQGISVSYSYAKQEAPEVNVAGEEGVKERGTYTVTATFSLSEELKKNYEKIEPAQKTAQLTIEDGIIESDAISIQIPTAQEGKDKLEYDGQNKPVTVNVQGIAPEDGYTVKIEYIKIESEEVQSEMGSTEPVNAGTYKARVTVSGTNNYVGSEVVKESAVYTIAKATPIIQEEIKQKLNDLNATYGDTLQNITEQLPTENTGGTLGSFNWQASGETTVGNVNVEGNLFTVIFTPQDAENYETVELDARVKVAKAELTLKNLDYENSLQNKVYNGQEQGVNVTLKGVLDGVGKVTVKYNDSETIPENVGSYTVKVSVSEGDNYTELTETQIGTYEITKSPITIKVNDVSVAYGKELQPLSYEIDETGGKTGLVGKDINVPDKNTVLNVELHVKNERGEQVDSTISEQPVGEYTITGESTSKNYEVTITDGTYTITSAEQVKPQITGPATIKMTDKEKTIIVENAESAQGEISYYSDTTEVLTVDKSTGKITPVKVGNATVRVVFEAAGNYSSSESTYTINVIRDKLTLTDFKVEYPENTYTGTEKQVTVTVKDGIVGAGRITVTYNKLVDGSLVVEKENVKLVDAGTYQVLITVTEGTHYEAITEAIQVGTFKINKAIYELTGVSFPEEGSDESKLEYTGRALTYTNLKGTIPNGIEVEFKGNSHIEVGNYEVTASFKFKDDEAGKALSANYESISPETITGKWEIIRGTLVEANFDIKDVSHVYDGTPKKAMVTSDIDGIGEISVQYRKVEDGEETGNWISEPIEAGTYNIKIAVTKGEKYEAAIILVRNKVLYIAKAQQDSPIVSLSKTEVKITEDAPKLTVENIEAKQGDILYTANPESIVQISAQGEITLVSAGKVTITVKFTGNNNYEESSATIDLTVKKDTLDASKFVVNNNTQVYSAEQKEVIVTPIESIKDGEIGDISVSYEGNATDVGTYNVRITVEEGTKYERIEDLLVGQLHITPATLTSDDIEFTIDEQSFDSNRKLNGYVATWAKVNEEQQEKIKEHIVETINLISKYSEANNGDVQFNITYKDLYTGSAVNAPTDIGYYGVTVTVTGHNFISSSISLGAFEIADTVAPTIEPSGITTIMIHTSPVDYKSFIKVHDDYDRVEDITIKWEGTIDTSVKNGKYSITYIATDSNKNQSEPCTVEITVKDYPPSIQTIDKYDLRRDISESEEIEYWDKPFSSVHIGWSRGTVTIYRESDLDSLENLTLAEVKNSEDLFKEEPYYTNTNGVEGKILNETGIYKIYVEDGEDVAIRYIKIDNRPIWELEANGEKGWKDTYNSSEVTLTILKCSKIQNAKVMVFENGVETTTQLIEQGRITENGQVQGDKLSYVIRCSNTAICRISIEDKEGNNIPIDNFFIQP